MARRALNPGDWVSLARVPLALLFVGLFRREPGVSLSASIVVAIVAQATDHLDGFLARRTGESSVTSWLFDSVSDRAFYIAAVLAFEREFGLNALLVWAFVFREVCLYAFRIVVGDFEQLRPGFRRWALIHAGLVRIGIGLGCAIPYELFSPLWNERAVMSGVLGAATAFGYLCLYLLVRSLR
jgi:phosphatidylglycerophosphate synthase